MTKFPILIIGPDWEKQIARFKGNNLKGIPKEQLEFFDEEPLLEHQWRTESVQRIKLKDGTLVSPFDPQFSKNGKHKVPKKLGRPMVPLRDMYETFDEFMEKYHDRTERDPEMGKFGYWWNREGKWDFVDTEAYKQFLVVRDPETGAWGYAWQAKNREVEWDKMKTAWLEEAEGRWQKYESEKIKAHLQNTDDKFLRAAFGIRPDDTHATFIERRGYISLFAVVYEGQWYQKGSNGWWSETMTLAKDWEPQLERLIQSLPDETPLTVIAVIPSEENNKD